MRVFLLCLFTFLCSAILRNVSAQSSQELIESLDEADTDGERYGILYDLTGILLESGRKTDRDLAVSFSKQLLTTSKRMGDSKLIGPAAFTLALAYQKQRDDRLTDRFMEEAVTHGMKAGDADLILRAVSERTRLAAKRQNYREATRINQQALDFFTKNGQDNNIDALRARLEKEQAALQRRRREVEQQTSKLSGEVDRLSREKNQLEGTNTQLQRENQTRNQQLAESAEELAARNEELEKTQEQKAAVEKRVAETRREIKSLSREALEQKAIANDAREQLMEAELETQAAEIKAERQTFQLYAAIGVGTGLFLLAALFFSRFRVKQRSAQKLSIANDALDEARKKSDELLENILPAEIAKELKETGKARARQFPDATVLFCDFVNFTATAERLGAEALVQELDVCFKAFDAIMDRYPGVEKIKTIGDAYMAASGLSSRKSVPHDIIRAALEMQRFLTEEGDKRRMLGLPYFTGRIGLHTGTVVAGVVGARKFAYDIWGDTVNVASRVESQSEPGRVNVSGSTYEMIRYRFRCTYRGKVEAKNKGMIDMYFVEEELSAAH
ncbi:adenylate/guanylate cyclase domain-containing protein [Neolewinella agarilytica]|uniref:Adenylate cyclase, class 3 n=1 Tax=Neolewinella agarilytica TaxID=478744 RepID=A0A1H9P3Q0_9BACT|nr:adenylate/guanylate cyclase domain-containing protein [Neolewinella agarilytica]SER42924.1 Adenylate cyclase, class 3 [Neolewinella agarilytica]